MVQGLPNKELLFDFLGDEEAMTRLRLLQHQHPARILEAQKRRQLKFVKKFAQGGANNLYTSSDRRGLVLNLLVMFRDIAPKLNNSIGFYKLSILVLKNNIQCELYSKANFQFELLARIGFCCPKLRVLDIFGTDTWADCLVALFFRDAFHSLHRYLFFMEDENDDQSAYHPHDLAKYCQFCLDRLHPVTVERPFTVNPIIPLVDPIYDHVIKRYPKRSYCILRNCIRVSDLIESPKSSVFELLRPSNTENVQPQQTSNSSVMNNNPEAGNDNICSRLRSRKRTLSQPRQVLMTKRKRKSEVPKDDLENNEEEEDLEVLLNKTDEIESLQGLMNMQNSPQRPSPSPKKSKNCQQKSKNPKDTKIRRRSSRLSSNSKEMPENTPQNTPEKIQKTAQTPKNPPSTPVESPEKNSEIMENMKHISFDDWQKETTLALSHQRLSASTTSVASTASKPSTNNKCPDSDGKMCFGCNAFYTTNDDSAAKSKKILDYSCIASGPSSEGEFDIDFRAVVSGNPVEYFATAVPFV